MGKSITLFAWSMGSLLNEILPENYRIYEAQINDLDSIEEGDIRYSRKVSASKFLKTIVEVSIYKGRPYIVLKHWGKPKPEQPGDKPYTGPTIEPDADGFYPTKGGTLTFEGNEDDPEALLKWAMMCRSLYY